MNEIEARVWELLRERYDRELADRCYVQVAWMLRSDDEITDELVTVLAEGWITA